MIKEIFTNDFNGHLSPTEMMDALVAVVQRHATFSPSQPKNPRTVFISHKHSELTELAQLIFFLEKTYNVVTYIDSRDEEMPKVTCGETAIRIKEKIKWCDKFILLATNGAVESKWCNWELGYGDAMKSAEDKIAIFPLNTGGDYKGNEYMQIYPRIVHYDGINDYCADSSPIAPGYYVLTKNKDDQGCNICPLENWLLKQTIWGINF